MSAPTVPHVAVVLAVHKPDRKLLSIQLESYRRQQGVTTRLFAVLDGEEACRDAGLRTSLTEYGATLIEQPEGVGVRRAFLTGLEAALTASPDEDTLFAFMDQDDRWHEEKLAACAVSLRGERAELVHCDARVVDANGTVIAHSLHALENRQRGESLTGSVLLNTVTGMTAVFTRATAEACISLENGLHSVVLHDHLLAVAASARGRTIFLDKVLLDYVSHGKNVVGPVGWRSRPLWARSFSASAVSRYCQTTARVFSDRRAIVEALNRQGLAPQNLCNMFLVSAEPPGVWDLSKIYIREIRAMKRAGQSRCARWLMRFLPLACWLRIGQRSRQAERQC